MKIKDLIAALKKYDQESLVQLAHAPNVLAWLIVEEDDKVYTIM